MMVFGLTFNPKVLFRCYCRFVVKILRMPVELPFFAWNKIPYRFDMRLVGFPCIENRGTILFGRNVILCNRSKGNSIGVFQPVRITVSSGAVLSIGDETGISGSSIFARHEVRIGNRVMIGSGCLIMDNDAHSLDPSARRRGVGGAAHSVIVEDDAFVGARSIVLKGVHIGKAAVVGAGSVVTRDVPDYAIVAGNPATIVGTVPRASGIDGNPDMQSKSLSAMGGTP